MQAAALQSRGKVLCAQASSEGAADQRALARQRLARAVLAAAMAVVLLLPSVFLVTEAEHHCTGDGCTVCHVLEGVMSLQNAGAALPDGAAMPAVALMFIGALLAAPTLLLSSVTLVSLKVRLDD